MTDVTYPRLNARTLYFTLGRPRSFSVSPDGRLILFVRSGHGTDKVGRLWCLDVQSGEERELVDPGQLLAGDPEQLSDEERARRERMREATSGIVGYTCDRDLNRVCFALSGRLFVADVPSGTTRELPVRVPAIDPQLDPSGTWVAYSSGGSLHLVSADGGTARVLAEPDGEHVVWGLAEFIAAEELERTRGFWWSPAGDQLLVERYDESPVQTWYVSDPTNPERVPAAHRYPAAGTPNAEVSLWLMDLDGERRLVDWDRETWEYVAAVHWSERGEPLVQLLDRRQRQSVVLGIDPATGKARTLRELSDPCWADVFQGVPCWGPTGELLTIEVVADRYALCADGVAVTPASLQVRGLLDVGTSDVLLSGYEHPLDLHAWRWSPDGTDQVTPSDGRHTALRGGQTLVVTRASLDLPLVESSWSANGASGAVTSVAEVPPFEPNVTILAAGADELRVAVVLPSGWQGGDSKLPVLMDPYGGPHGQQVAAAQGLYRDSQWFADQGFGVVVVDGRGTPGGPTWERAVSGDFAPVVLEDQIAGLQLAARAFPELDLGRVGIRGWSFGGELAALAVLERPDVFHAAVAGAPVTDQHLYDTAYTERYLGLPSENPDGYRNSSLIHRAASLSRPLQIIHGFADDNVFVTHSLKLSQALTEHGRPHEFLPLTGTTHMAVQEDVAENLLNLQVRFLRQALGLGASPLG